MASRIIHTGTDFVVLCCNGKEGSRVVRSHCVQAAHCGIVCCRLHRRGSFSDGALGAGEFHLIETAVEEHIVAWGDSFVDFGLNLAVLAVGKFRNWVWQLSHDLNHGCDRSTCRFLADRNDIQALWEEPCYFAPISRHHAAIRIWFVRR